MATIEKRVDSKKNISYRLIIRKRGQQIYKTFINEEDAKLYAFFKERLINLMENFDISLNQTLTFEQLFDLKIKSLKNVSKRTTDEFPLTLKYLQEIIGKNKFVHSFSFDQWKDISKKMHNLDVYKGSKNEVNKRKMSLSSLRRHFANISSCISYAQSSGIEIDNHPLKVIQTIISPLKNSGENQSLYI